MEVEENYGLARTRPIGHDIMLWLCIVKKLATLTNVASVSSIYSLV